MQVNIEYSSVFSYTFMNTYIIALRIRYYFMWIWSLPKCTLDQSLLFPIRTKTIWIHVAYQDFELRPPVSRWLFYLFQEILAWEK